MRAARFVGATGLACCLALLATTGVQAQTNTQTRVSVQSSRFYETSKIVGTTVYLQDNVTFGKVQNFVINEDGCVQYLVIAYQSDVAFVPWSVVHYQQNVVRVDITKEKIRQVTFQKGQVPSFTSTNFTRRVQAVFGGSRSHRGQRREQGATETQEPTRNQGNQHNNQNNRSTNPNKQPTNNNRGQNQPRPNQNQNPNQVNPNQRGGQPNVGNQGQRRGTEAQPQPTQTTPAPAQRPSQGRNPQPRNPNDSGRQPSPNHQPPPVNR